MELETDLARISRLAKEREVENWNFRWFLKHPGRTSSDVDGIVHRLWEEMSRQIACTNCANCCRLLRPYLSSRDVRRLSRHLRMAEAAFEDRYLKPAKEGDEDGRPFEARPCPFLSGDRCTVYPARPTACRSYPNLHQRGFLNRASQAFTNCAVCPVVFNVYEGLKRALSVALPGPEWDTARRHGEHGADHGGDASRASTMAPPRSFHAPEGRGVYQQQHRQVCRRFSEGG